MAFHACADALPEYRLKAAFLYNFAAFTEWPPEVGGRLNVCVYGNDPFGPELDSLQGKKVGERSVVVHRRQHVDALSECQVLFLPQGTMDELPRVLDALNGAPVLTVADSAGAALRGIVVNLSVRESRMTFEVNLKAARAARLQLSAKLLRLASEVEQ
jgi:hypothetical protein